MQHGGSGIQGPMVLYRAARILVKLGTFRVEVASWGLLDSGSSRLGGLLLFASQPTRMTFSGARRGKRVTKGMGGRGGLRVWEGLSNGPSP